jgi:hypothetical protein
MAGSNWWVPTQPGPAFPGGTTTGGGGSVETAGAVQYRSPLDADRAAKGSIPSAEYPDGYLGTITNRREDKLLEAVQERLTERSYQRGVHKGSKIGPQDYHWDESVLDPMSGIRREARTAKRVGTVIQVEKWAPRGNPVEKLAHMGKTAGLSAPEQMNVYKKYGVSPSKNPVVLQDPGRVERMQKMLPRYAM